MSDITYVKEALKTEVFNTEVGRALAVLENHHVFSFLRETSDKILARGMETRPDVNGLIVSAAEHVGYVRAIDHIEQFLDTIPILTNVIGSKSTYGVKREDKD